MGREGESLARKYVEKAGFEVRACNWRWGHLELDIVATRNGTLHIIEVKTRQDTSGGFPEESVTRKKLLNLIKAAEAYQLAHHCTLPLQFDILAIVIDGNTEEITLIEDVYL